MYIKQSIIIVLIIYVYFENILFIIKKYKMGFWDFIELGLSSVYLAICFITFIWRLTKPDAGHLFLEYEMWAIMALMFYYIIFLLIGFKRLFSKEKEKKEKKDKKEEEPNNGLQKLLKNILFKYLWPFVMSSAVIFYLGYFFGWFKLDTANKGNDFVFSIFQHGLCQIGFLIDLILFRRKYIDTHFIDFSAMYIGYCVLLLMIKPEIKTYNFLSEEEFKDDYGYIISLMIICYFVYLYLYFFYMYVVKFKSGVRNLFWGDDKKDKKEKESLIDNNKEKGDQVNEEENKIN